MVEKDSTNEEMLRKFKELSNSRDLYAWRLSNYPEVKSALNYILDEMKSEVGIGKRYAKKYIDHIRVIVLDLFVANQNDPTSYITFSRNSNNFKPGTKYGRMHLSYEISKKINDFLIKNAYIDYTEGFYNKDRPFSSKKPRMRATEKLIRLLKNDNEIEEGMIHWDESEPTLILRDDEKKEIIDFQETDDTIQILNNLKVINRNLQKHAILLYVPNTELKKINERLNRDPQKSPIDFTQKRLRRIFNGGSFEKGGRFYGGWWQNIPKEYRKYIRINDKDVVECDFSGLHINMLYAKEGLPLPEEDPYELAGYGDIREFLKQALLRLVNADSRTSVIRSLKDKRNPAEAIDIPDHIDSIDDVLDDFMLKHSQIQKYFGTGIGIDLQYLDSKIAEKVLLHFSRMGYAILPMHDSFIIHHALQNELEEEMNNAFYEIFGVKCNVDLKYNSIEERQKQQGEELEVCDTPIDELFAEISEDGEYGTYYRLLNQHRKYKFAQGFPGEIRNDSR